MANKMFKKLTILVAGTLCFSAMMYLWQYRDTTIYAESYSDAAFAAIEVGMAVSEVQSLLGNPLEIRQGKSLERWLYDEGSRIRKTGFFSREYTYDLAGPSRSVEFDEEGKVWQVSSHYSARIRPGMSHQEVESRIGIPLDRIPASSRAFHYSKPGGDGLFRGKIVKFNRKGQVTEIVTYRFYD